MLVVKQEQQQQQQETNFSQAELNTLRETIKTLESQLQHWRTRAQRDSLTGCLRRDSFMELIEERKSFGLLPKNASLAIIDVDHFKKINDTHGHLVGDEVLKELGALLNAEIGNATSGAALCRMGGEEFVVMIPESVKNSKLILENLRAKIESHKIQIALNKHINFSISIGLAEWNTDQHIIKATAEADKALYEAKKGGRNQLKAA